MKVCHACKEEKSLNEFHKVPRASCKQCVNAASARWRLRNLEHARGYFTNERIKVSAWKASFGCKLCSEKNPVCLDMHHIDPTTKDKDPSRIGKFESFLKEASKCVVLCRNCHAKVHAGVCEI